MANTIIYSKVFIRKAKVLRKRHASVVADLEELERNLLTNPRQGSDLGGGLYKVRLAIKSKLKGKSGGYRIITYLVTQTNAEVTINMVTLYDKSDESSVDKKFLIELVKELYT
nr:type II toxin-antitoxin system RelE/ParE family toxin [uncultured Mucilaginibacter sp.]